MGLGNSKLRQRAVCGSAKTDYRGFDLKKITSYFVIARTCETHDISEQESVKARDCPGACQDTLSLPQAFRSANEWVSAFVEPEKPVNVP